MQKPSAVYNTLRNMDLILFIDGTKCGHQFSVFNDKAASSNETDFSPATQRCNVAGICKTCFNACAHMYAPNLEYLVHRLKSSSETLAQFSK